MSAYAELAHAKRMVAALEEQREDLWQRQMRVRQELERWRARVVDAQADVYAEANLDAAADHD